MSFRFIIIIIVHKFVLCWQHMYFIWLFFYSSQLNCKNPGGSVANTKVIISQLMFTKIVDVVWLISEPTVSYPSSDGCVAKGRCESGLKTKKNKNNSNFLHESLTSYWVGKKSSAASWRGGYASAARMNFYKKICKIKL